MIKDDFIGKSYYNIKGNKVTVISCIDDTKLLEDRSYVCRCEVCSKDEELWPDGSLILSRRSIRDGRSNCSCVKTKYSLTQWEIILKRKAEKIGCCIIRVYKTDRKKRSLRLDYKDTKGNIVSDISVENFLERKEDINPYLKQDTYYIEQYLLKSGKTDKIFCRESSQSWKFKCLTCEDVIKSLRVDQLPVFKTKGGSLLEGSVGCLCNSQTSLTEDYLIAKVSKMLEDNKRSFISSEKFSGTNTYIKWQCPDGHINRSKYVNIMNGKGCRGCRDANAGNQLYGKYLDREDTLYFMTLKEDDETCFYKVGRSFEPSKRLNNIRMVYPSAEIFHTFEAPHKEIYEAEGTVKAFIKDEGLLYNTNKYFAGCLTECFCTDDIGFLISLSEKKIKC